MVAHSELISHKVVVVAEVEVVVVAVEEEEEVTVEAVMVVLLMGPTDLAKAEAVDTNLVDTVVAEAAIDTAVAIAMVAAEEVAAVEIVMAAAAVAAETVMEAQAEADLAIDMVAATEGPARVVDLLAEETVMVVAVQEVLIDMEVEVEVEVEVVNLLSVIVLAKEVALAIKAPHVEAKTLILLAINIDFLVNSSPLR